ncbi:hypothetical protein SAMN05216520_102103 [Kandleria vitulina]|jgi:hypothetical protein|uniref:hypothetical protein n=1 Tax=Kandleria vitulina TaxID=1630 RepID=UPI00088048B3|nr:hypothetical protein [Kandleria vitulina]SDL21899.1 hypothetical protein SAMN05216520_102103 [Kandleria vitulina]
MNSYISEVNYHDFHELLMNNHIHVDQSLEQRLLSVLKNNVYALDNATYSFVLVKYMSKFTDLENDCIRTLISSIRKQS